MHIDPDGVETALLARLVGLDGLRVLELGCGDGRLTRRYAASVASVLAVDTKADAIADARRQAPPNVRFEVARASEVDAPAGAFDLAFFSWSL